MEIIRLPVSGINPAPYNPRKDLKPDDSEYQKLLRSIDEFGYIDPLVWNRRTGNLVGGHQRFKILIHKGYKEIEVSVVDLDMEKEKALNIALNKVQGSWDNEKLATLLDELSKMPDFDIESTGFTPVEISQLFDRYLQIGDEDNFDTVGVANSITEPVTQKGDLIELGPHRILCDDCSVLDNLKRLLSIEIADIVYADPPYNVAYKAGERPNPNGPTKKSSQWTQIHSDNMVEKDYQDLLWKVFSNITPFMNIGTSCERASHQY